MIVRRSVWWCQELFSEHISVLVSEERSRCIVEFDFIIYTVVISDNVFYWTELHKTENTLAISY